MNLPLPGGDFRSLVENGPLCFSPRLWVADAYLRWPVWPPPEAISAIFRSRKTPRHDRIFGRLTAAISTGLGNTYLPEIRSEIVDSGFSRAPHVRAPCAHRSAIRPAGWHGLTALSA